jgi:prepilin-type N-terminal cleavage/methylation domain-containing protein
MSRSQYYGFTLSELLISLAILGLIAAFAIPKIISAQQDESNNSKVKEMAGAIVAANDAYLRASNNYNGEYNGQKLTPYMNYVAVDSTTTLTGGVDCSSPCIVMHNGGMLRPQMCNFGGTANTNAIAILFDPDGAGPAVSVKLWLYRTGMIRTSATVLDGTTNQCNPTVTPSADPSWFHW